MKQRTQLLGKVNSDIQVLNKNSGHEYIRFSFILTDSLTETPRTWHNVKYTGKFSRRIIQSVRKGDMVFIDVSYSVKSNSSPVIPEDLYLINLIRIDKSKSLVNRIYNNGNRTRRVSDSEFVLNRL